MTHPLADPQPATADLPRFVQVRAYDKGLAVARIVRDPMRRFGAPTIEGTRISPFDLTGELEVEAIERVAEVYDLTVEQVVVARDWLAAHPECPNPRHANPRSRKNCPDCDDHGYVFSAEEMAEIRRVDQEVRGYWAKQQTEETP